MRGVICHGDRMTTVQIFKVQAQYNRWMNEHFYGLCDTISDEKRKRDMGAFFNSVHGTLNHLLLGDKIWMSRFLQTSFEIESLDQELYSDYGELKKERKIVDKEIFDYINSLNEKVIEGLISFTSHVQKARRKFVLRDCLLHFFHHQTHHRGQLSTLISQLGIDIGVTDLMWMPGIEKSGEI